MLAPGRKFGNCFFKLHQKDLVIKAYNLVYASF